MRFEKALVVAGFELRSTVLRTSFLVTTAIFPLVLLGVTGGTLAIEENFVAAREREGVVVALVDESGLVGGDGREGVTRFRAVPTLQDAVSGLARGELDAIYEIPSTWLRDGEVNAYTRAAHAGAGIGELVANRDVERLLVRRLLAREVDEAIGIRVLEPARVVERTVTARGSIVPQRPLAERTIATLVVPATLAVLLLSSLLLASGYLVQAIVVDKETKIVEVLLSSAGAEELLAGKLLGLGAAGLLQFAVWGLFASVIGSTALAMVPDAIGSIPWRALAFAPLFFVLGYLFLGSLMVATGSLGSSAAEAQKLTTFWLLLALLPLMWILPLLDDPHGTAGRVLSLVPFSAPLALVLRLAVDADGVGTWDLALSVGILLVSTLLSVRFGARLFRVGLLLSGESPGLRAVLEQARLAPPRRRK